MSHDEIVLRRTQQGGPLQHRLRLHSLPEPLGVGAGSLIFRGVEQPPLGWKTVRQSDQILSALG